MNAGSGTVMAALSAVSVLMLPLQAAAWDIAPIGVAGPELRGGEAVILLGQELYVRPERVELRARWHNRSQSAAEVVLTHALPAVRGSHLDAAQMLPHEAPDFTGFTLLVDGAPADLAEELRAFHDGEDITARLDLLGLPLPPFDGDVMRAAIESLSDEARAALGEGGLLRYGYPMWSVAARFAQTLTLAPGQEVVIELAYAPAIGFDFGEFEGCAMPAEMAEAARLQRQTVRRSTHIVEHLFPGGVAAPLLVLAEAPGDADTVSIWLRAPQADAIAGVARECLTDAMHSAPGRAELALDPVLGGIAPGAGILVFFGLAQPLEP
ncbi:MAG: DUF4424 family protein [Pararhodobacter sp.]|nr:DUF4424 family protein [Pararhodobacter sp.]